MRWVGGGIICGGGADEIHGTFCETYISLVVAIGVQSGKGAGEGWEGKGSERRRRVCETIAMSRQRNG